MTFELWDTETGNLVGAYATETAALEVVDRAVTKYGPSHADTLVLILDDDGEEVKSLAGGADLVARAQELSAAALLGAS